MEQSKNLWRIDTDTDTDTDSDSDTDLDCYRDKWDEIHFVYRNACMAEST